MPRLLFLDDNEERVRSFLCHVPQDLSVVVVRDAIMAIEALIYLQPSVLFLDHDLGGEQMVAANPLKNTGSMVVEALVAHDFPHVRRIICHSLNTPARKLMVERLKSADTDWEVWDAPFVNWNWQTLHRSWEDL